MPLSRQQFLATLFAAPEPDNISADKDLNFNRYANKTLPAAKTTSLTLDEYTGPWAEKQIKHLLGRTLFGVKQEDVDLSLGMTMGSTVDLLLDNTIPVIVPPVNNYTAPGTVDLTGVPYGETWITTDFGDGTVNSIRNYSYKAWWIGKMINQNFSIHEKMVFFWHNHFSTQTPITADARFSYQHNTVLRANALGNFRDFVKAITKDGAMLKYLNGYLNTKNAPDENYGRELQELFTVGKNNAANYTEDDVKAAARVLTGWNVNNTSLQSFFISQFHDTSDKQFSAFYGNTIISGVSGGAGTSETEALVEMIFTKNEAAHFICTKLYRFFIYYNITADIDANIIAPLAQLLVDSNYELKPVVRKLLKSTHFFDSNNMGCYIKTPLDFIVGMFRVFDITFPPGVNVNDKYATWNILRDYGARMGLNLADPPNVAGWPAFYQSPAYYQLWINSSTLPLRMSFSDMMVSTGFNTPGVDPVSIDVIKFAQQYANAGDAELLITWMAALLLGVDIATEEIAQLKSILLSGQSNATYWTDAWNAYVADPNDENTTIVKTRLKSLLTTMLRLPEYQLC